MSWGSWKTSKNVIVPPPSNRHWRVSILVSTESGVQNKLPTHLPTYLHTIYTKTIGNCDIGSSINQGPKIPLTWYFNVLSMPNCTKTNFESPVQRKRPFRQFWPFCCYCMLYVWQVEPCKWISSATMLSHCGIPLRRPSNHMM